MFVAGLLVLVTLLDQITKYWVWRDFRLGEARTVIPGFLDLRYIRNEGAAWGMFSGHRWPLIAVSVVMLALLIAHRREILELGRMGALALGLLGGGILGNLIDRVRYGYVVDFLDFHWGSSHFPAFNVADSSICLGVALYMILSFVPFRRRADDPARPLESVVAPLDSDTVR